MKDLCAELWNFLGNVVLRKILGTFAFGKNFLRGPWNGRGPKFWNTPPQPETGWHGPGPYHPGGWEWDRVRVKLMHLVATSILTLPHNTSF
jgi:hypothetical protein